MPAPTWFRPWMLWLAAVALLGGLLAAQTVRLAQAETALAQEQSAHAETVKQHAVEFALAQTSARQTEAILRDDLDKLAAQAAKEKEDAKAREDALVERVRTGERRLSIPVARCVPADGSASPGAAAAEGGGAGQARAELDPATAERILRITRDGDEAIRERNLCVDAYELMRKRINEARPPTHDDSPS